MCALIPVYIIFKVFDAAEATPLALQYTRACNLVSGEHINKRYSSVFLRMTIVTRNHD